MKFENKKKPETILNSMKLSTKILDSKELKYRNNNHRSSYGNLHQINNKKYVDLMNSDNKLLRSYNTGFLINHLVNDGKLIIQNC